MPRALVLLVLLLVPACADSSFEADDAAADAGSVSPVDASLPFFDAGNRDAGTADAAVAGRCELGAPLVHLEEQESRLALGAIAMADARVALAYTSGDSARLRLSDAAGELVADVEVPATGPLFPEALAFAADRFLLAGSQEGGSRFSLLDGAGALQSGSELADHRPLAALRDGEGGLVLTVGSPANLAMAESAVLARLDGQAALNETLTVGPTTRADSSWDLAMVPDGAPRVCGSARDARGEWLAVFGVGQGEMLLEASAEPLAAVAGRAADAFGCRIAAATALSAVAVSETGGTARLIWLNREAATLAGPVPFTNGYRPARQYDVAMLGAETALAFFDDSSGPSRVMARVFSNPGGEASDLRLDEGLGLGDFTANRVRVIADGERFLVAFDAVQSSGPTHVIVRAVTCGR